MYYNFNHRLQLAATKAYFFVKLMRVSWLRLFDLLLMIRIWHTEVPETRMTITFAYLHVLFDIHLYPFHVGFQITKLSKANWLITIDPRKILYSSSALLPITVSQIKTYSERSDSSTHSTIIAWDKIQSTDSLKHLKILLTWHVIMSFDVPTSV